MSGDAAGGKVAPVGAAALEAVIGGDEVTDPLAGAAAWVRDFWAAGEHNANALALATVDADGAPNVRFVLLRGVEEAAGGQAGDGGERGQHKKKEEEEEAEGEFERGFVFYTNSESAKGVELMGSSCSSVGAAADDDAKKQEEGFATGARAAGALYSRPLERQLRFRGRVVAVSAAISDAYWNQRPAASRCAAAASAQSRPLPSRDALLARVAAMEASCGGGDSSPAPSCGKSDGDGTVPAAAAAESEQGGARAPERPAHWRGFRVVPDEVEFWCSGAARLHDRFRWTRYDSPAAAQAAADKVLAAEGEYDKEHAPAAGGDESPKPREDALVRGCWLVQRLAP